MRGTAISITVIRPVQSFFHEGQNNGTINFELTRENIFCMTWKKSDLVLVVENTEFRVHRSNLVLQSPVFETMVNGDFKEAKQHRIALSDESATDILQFLKLLYPKNLIQQPNIPLEGEYLVLSLSLSEYCYSHRTTCEASHD